MMLNILLLVGSQFKMFGDHCPYCGTFNSDINKDSIIALVIAAIIFGLIYFLS
jgi:hypothetical protein